MRASRSGVAVSACAVAVAVAVAVAGLLAVAVAPARGKAACPKPRSRSLILVSARTGRVDRSFPDTDLPPLAMVTDGRGGWFVGGDVSCVGRVRVNGLVHLRPDGRLDRRWHTRVPCVPIAGGVAQLARVGDTLYVNNGSWVEALDARSGARRWLDTNLKGGWGLGLAANPDTVFVGGYGGSKFHGTPHPAPVALDARTGKVLRWHAALPRRFVNVASLALYRGRLYMDVSAANGFTATVLAVDANTGRVTGWRAPQIKEIGGLLVTHGLVFSAAQDGNSAVANAGTGRPVSFPGAERYTGLTTLAAAGNTLYAWSGQGCNQGPFTIQGENRDVAAIDLRTLRVTSWAPVLGKRCVCVGRIAADRNRVLVAS